MDSRKTAPATRVAPSRTTPAARAPRKMGTPASKRARARANVKQRIPWHRRVDPARVALVAVLVALVACAGLLLDVYLGANDPVHVAMVSAFGPLAFLVPIGAALLAVDFYRRHEGRRPWLRFEESCGAVILFISALILASIAGLAYSLVGNSLSDELAGIVGGAGAFLVALALFAIGLILLFHITAAQLLAAARVAWGGLALAARGVNSLLLLLHRHRARRPAGGHARAASSRAAPAGMRPQRRPRATSADDAILDPDLDDDTVLTRSSPSLPARAPVSAVATRAKAPRRQVAVDEPPAAPDFGALDADDEPEEEALPVPTTPAWPTPTTGLLDAVPPAVSAPANNDARARIIEETLASFNVSAEVVDVQAGPTVTQFSLRPAPGVRVQRITALSNDLALALAAPSIRIEAPVPGKPVVGIEIPNATTALVTLRELLESDAYVRMRSPLKIGLGKNVSGEPVVVDLARMPHLLIAGATGSGKSVCLNSLIACLLFHNTPERLRLLMIDPKMVELTTFNGVPHLLHPVVTEMDKVSGTLKWALKEMHRRYRLFGDEGARNIARYNELQYEKEGRGEKNEPLPYIVFIIDELADLMMVSPAEVEDSISRLAALARATGIHLVLATQRPSVDVITGVIKANFPARIAFAVSSQVDSRTILDHAGAEKLMGRGDMLYLPSDGSKTMRIQGTYLSDQEIEKLVEFWKRNTPYDTPGAPVQIPTTDLQAPQDGGEGESNEDKLLADATKVVREYRRASVSLLQRRLSIGYSRAARLLDQLEERGVVGPSEDGRSRVVRDTGADDGDEAAPAAAAGDAD